MVDGLFLEDYGKEDKYYRENHTFLYQNYPNEFLVIKDDKLISHNKEWHVAMDDANKIFPREWPLYIRPCLPNVDDKYENTIFKPVKLTNIDSSRFKFKKLDGTVSDTPIK